MPDDDYVIFEESGSFMSDAARQRLNDAITDHLLNNLKQTGWDAPHSDPLTDLYNAMQSVSGEMVLRQPNREGVYVITTLQPRSSNGD